jgi:phosphatidylserine decarboxylase
MLNFFRDPERITPTGDNIVVSPADGKVVLIKEVFEPEYLKQDALQISIFMSPLDVHVNRFPISGKVGYFRYIQGEYVAAFEDKSSERNERTHIGVEENGFKILFKQIAGAVARRIVAPISIGQEAQRGKRFGMIKFGSRVDVLMPTNVHIQVKLNDRVRAGETVLAAIVSSMKNVSQERSK